MKFTLKELYAGLARFLEFLADRGTRRGCGAAMQGPRALVEGLIAAAASGARRVFAARSVWGAVLEPRPQRVGTVVYMEGGATLRVSRVGGVYGYFEAALGDCRVSGPLVYGQAGFRFILGASSVGEECKASRLPEGLRAEE